MVFSVDESRRANRFAEASSADTHSSSAACPPYDNDEVFYRVWTAKRSMLLAIFALAIALCSRSCAA